MRTQAFQAKANDFSSHNVLIFYSQEVKPCMALYTYNDSHGQDNRLKDQSILQYDVIFLSLDFLRKLRGFSKSFAYVGSVAKGNIG